ncbi:Tn3 family transposase [Catenulispora rubra]|uniref:Tn3 family transposase n=1 Tax=Catenulispora rubra TaxID=280293 RepID=UPI0018923093|nr:Tn3 family transposase [Catenulispora rubra]
MATRVFTDEELINLRSFPEITPSELIRFFTLAPPDIEFVDPGRGRGAPDRLGLAVQLCTLPWLGFVPDDVTEAPPAAVARLSEQLRIPVGELRHYAAKREQTRTDHLLQVARYLRWRATKAMELKELDEFLLARAMEHDSPSLLFTLACEHMKSSRVIRLGVVKLLERVATARAEAGRETYSRVAHLLTPSMMAELDGLLHHDAAVRGTRLKWLTTPPVSDSPDSIKKEIGKLAFLRDLDAHTMDLSMLPAERRRFLHSVGHRLTGQALLRRESSRRHPILLAVLAQSAIGTLDDVVALFDQSVSARESRAKRKLTATLADRAKSAEERLALLDDILPVVVDVGIPDEEVGAILRGFGLERLRGALATAQRRLPRDHGHLALMTESYNHLREFTPAVLDAVEFAGGTTAAGLMEAVKVLRGLNRRKGRNVPDGAPDDFVPARWRGYLADAIAAGDSVAYRHFWELTVLLALRDGLRSGDVWVPGSRRYANPASYLFTPSQWEPKRVEFCHLVGKSPKAADALKAAFDEHATAMTDLESVLAKSKGKVGEVRIDDNGDLVIPQLTAEDVPAEVDELRKELISRLPFAPIASLLIELDRRTGFLECFTHAGGKQARSPQLKRNLLAVLIGHATNLGLTRMAEATGISYDVLAWTAEWYLREETLAAANAAIVDYHHRLPLTQTFGGGTLSSSDGQRFPVRGKSTTARAAKKWFADRGLSTYTWVSDQYSTYGTKIIVVTHREAQYVLDEIMGNATDLPITEHATDTHGVTLVNFGLFDLVGLQLSPRIRDLGKVTLYRTGPRAQAVSQWPIGGHLLTRRLNQDLVTEHWDDLLRLAGSVKFGQATASLIVGKLSASSRQNSLAAALKEYGALRRSIYAARYLADEGYRRRITRQLNKGEHLHALRRDLRYAHNGAFTSRHLMGQTESAWCLTLLTNGVVTWTTEYYGLAVAAMRAEGRHVDDEALAHISPAHSENVNFFGIIDVDVEGELAKLDGSGYRPLRDVWPEA